MKISNTQVSFLNVFSERTVAEITGDASGNVIATRDYVDASTGGTANSWSLTFDGDGTESEFTFTNPFTYNPVMVQVINVDTGYYVAQGTGFTIKRVNTSSPDTSTITIDFQSPLALGVDYTIMIQKIAQQQM